MVMTADGTSLPRKASATSFILTRIMDEISSGKKSFSSPLNVTRMEGRSPSFWTTLKGKCFMSDWVAESVKRRPIRRLASKTVLTGFMAAWFLAASPIMRSLSVKATNDGVVRLRGHLAERPRGDHRQRPGQPHHPVVCRLHGQRAHDWRCSQEPGRHESVQHRLRRQAPDRPPLY